MARDQLGDIGFRLIGGYNRSTPRRGTRDMLSAFSKSPILQAVVRKIAYGVASVEWKVCAVMPDGTEVEIPNHPMRSVLSGGVPGLSSLQMTMVEETNLLLVGEVFSLLDRNITSAPDRRYVIPADWVRDTPRAGIGKFEINPPHSGETIMVPPEDVLWFKDPDPLKPYDRGVGVGRSLADEINSDEAAARHIASTLLNRALPETVVSGSVEAPLSREDVQRMEEVFRERFGGPSRAGRAMFTSVPITATPLTPSFRELDLTNLRAFERDIIIQAFGVPPEIIGMIENSNRATIDAAEYLFAKHVLVPRLEARMSVFNEQLAPQYPDPVVARYESPVEEDKSFRRQMMLDSPSAFSINERRELVGLGPLESDMGELFPISITTSFARDLREYAAMTEPKPPALEPAPVQGGIEDGNEETELEERSAILLKATGADIERVVQSIDEDVFRRILEEILAEVGVSFGMDAIEMLGAQIDFGLFEERIRAHMAAKAADRSRLITGTTREKLRSTLSEGVSLGENTDSLVARIQSAVIDSSRSRARMISRTEIVRASNEATTEAHRESGIARRQWLSTQDNSVRDSHMVLDGQVVGIDEPFTYDGYSAMYPGDFGRADLDINCRCAVLPVFPEEITVERRKMLWIKYDRRRIPFERLLEDQARRALRAQGERAIEVLRGGA